MQTATKGVAYPSRLFLLCSAKLCYISIIHVLPANDMVQKGIHFDTCHNTKNQPSINGVNRGSVLQSSQG